MAWFEVLLQVLGIQARHRGAKEQAIPLLIVRSTEKAGDRSERDQRPEGSPVRRDEGMGWIRMSNQPNALRLAQWIEDDPLGDPQDLQCAAELRRLHSINAELLEALQSLVNTGLDEQTYRRVMSDRSHYAITAIRRATEEA